MEDQERQLYQKVEEQIGKVNFSKLWKDFQPYPFALYTQEKVLLKDKEQPWNDSFLGNTSIEDNGKPLAIWNIRTGSEQEDIAVLTSGLVHEMFHCYQKENEEVRFPKELELLCYPLIEENFQMKYQEQLYLLRAVQEKNLQEKEKYLAQFVSLRKKRMQQFEFEARNELLIETVEGLAEFVEMKTLEQLDEEKYRERLEKVLSWLAVPHPLLLEVRRMAYYTGALLGIVLAEMDRKIPQELHQQETFFEQIQDSFPEVEVEWGRNRRVSALLQEKKRENEELIQSFQATAGETITGSWQIVGYDPMNMTREGVFLYCSHFIFLKDTETDEKQYIAGPLLLKMQADSLDKAEKVFLS